MSMIFKDDVRSWFTDITDYHTGFGAVLKFDWQGDDSVVISPKDDNGGLIFNSAFRKMFNSVVDDIKHHIERVPEDYSITYYDEERCIVCITEGNTVNKSFNDMVKKQRDKNIQKNRDYKTFVLEEIGELWHHFTLLEGWAVPDSEYGRAIAELHEALADFNRKINNMPQFE